jgi:predicted SAM-dependent methyltransferase
MKERLKDFLDESGLIFLARSIQSLFAEFRVLLWHWSGRLKARKYRSERGLRLHFGCGPNVKAGWINIDLSHRADIRLDLRKKLPFSAASCVLSHSEHFFEHLDFPDDARRFLAECYRVTEPGGMISLGVPDAGAVLVLYARHHADSASAKQAWHPDWVETWMGRVNWLFRQNYTYHLHQHRFAYDFVTLERLLRQVGFTDVRQREFDPELDSESRKGSTLYVTGRKPQH